VIQFLCKPTDREEVELSPRHRSSTPGTRCSGTPDEDFEQVYVSLETREVLARFCESRITAR